MSQIQCPNCRGYKVGTPGPGCARVGLGLWAILSGVFGIVIGFMGGSLDSELLSPEGNIIVGFLILAGGIWFIAQNRNYVQHHHVCEICGYQWET